MGKYLTAAKNEVKLNFRYRFNLLAFSTGLLFPLLGYVFLWKTAYSGGGRVGEYSLNGLFTYYFWALFLDYTLPVFAYGDMAWNIKSGGLTLFLVRPFSFLFYYVSIIAGGTLVWATVNLAVLVPFGMVFARYFIFPGLTDFLVGFLFTAIGYFLALLLGFVINLLAFYLGDPSGFRGLYGWGMMLLGGSIIPLDLLGFPLDRLPFRFLYFIPAKAFMGEIRGDILGLLFEDVLWASISLFLVFLLWKRGLRKYEAYGG